VSAVAEAYCVKCKAKKEMAKAQEVTMKNGRPAMQGVCPDCGTKLFRIMGGKK
jgi:Zn finger protein HypA/HybF involved in hydrogenase expression